MENQKNSLTLFQHQDFGQVRVIKDEATGEPWFVAKDICAALGYSNPKVATQGICKGVRQFRTPTAGGPQIVSYISESDVYRLIIRSKLPGAERFESWVMEEVLPAIRKTGGYLVAAQNESPEAIMARAILVAQDTIKRIEAEKLAAEAKLAKGKRIPLLTLTEKAAKSRIPLTVARIVTDR